MSNLPHPKKLADINALISSEMESHWDELYKDRYATERTVDSKLYDLGFGTKSMLTITFEDFDSPLLNAYSVHRAINQVNEACNKLWAAVEFTNVISPKVWKQSYVPLGEQFLGKFTLGSLIPTLYYAHLSAIVSMLSSFGCVSIRDFVLEKDYNLVRTMKNWNLFRRNKYIKEVLSRKPSRSWHLQVYELMAGVSKNIDDFPKDIDPDMTDELRKERNRTHYIILGEVSAKPIMGLDSFFKFLPLVVNTITTAIRVICEVCKSRYNIVYCANRFKNLHENLPKLYEAHKKEYPKREIQDIQF